MAMTMIADTFFSALSRCRERMDHPPLDSKVRLPSSFASVPVTHLDGAPDHFITFSPFPSLSRHHLCTPRFYYRGMVDFQDCLALLLQGHAFPLRHGAEVKMASVGTTKILWSMN